MNESLNVDLRMFGHDWLEDGLGDQAVRRSTLVRRRRLLDENPNEDVRVDGDAHSGRRISSTDTRASLQSPTLMRRALGS